MCLLSLAFVATVSQEVEVAKPRVRLNTPLGEVVIELEAERAPGTCANFLRYVDGGFYDAGRFHRTVTDDNQPNDNVKIAVIQASIARDRRRDSFPAIPLERTRDTGLRHGDGAVSMARGGPDTARSDFFVCVGPQLELDFGGARNSDGQGFAVFGTVVEGMDVVRAIHSSPAEGQRLTPPITIERAGRELIPPWEPEGDGLYARLTTSEGEIVLRLEFERTPMTVTAIVGLAGGTLRNDAFPPGRPYFDGTVFHRVVPGHVIQAGAPASEEHSGPGFQFPNEIDPKLSHGRAGVLGMARGAMHSNSSQFYITLGDRSYLDGDYTVFGEVVAGMEVVCRITQGDVIQSVRIERVGEKAAAFAADTASFEALVVAAHKKVADKDALRARREAEFVQEHWPQAKVMASGLRQLVQHPGAGEPARAGERITLRYTGQTLSGLQFCSLPDARPDFGDEGGAFEHTVGTDYVNPGFDGGVADLRPGERRILIVPADLGYGDGGFYGKQTKGERRFVISPQSLLVYSVERLER